MLLPSIGFTCAIFCSKDATLTRGTRMTEPEICAGSSNWMRRSTARMDEYSVPCAPATIASTGPGFAPCTIATAMLLPASTPAGTAMTPVTFCPRAASAVPTFSVGRGSAMAWEPTTPASGTIAARPSSRANFAADVIVNLLHPQRDRRVPEYSLEPGRQSSVRKTLRRGRNPRGVTQWGPALQPTHTPEMRFAGLREREDGGTCRSLRSESRLST